MKPIGEARTLDDVPQVDASTAHEEWKRGEVGILDVREPEEWQLGHIEGIEWIPMGQLSMRWRELDPDRKWVCVCRAGIRSNYAALMLRQVGIDAANMEGGMLDWTAHNFPMTPP